MRLPSVDVQLSGARFSVYYSIIANDTTEAAERALGLAYEQTVEFPGDLTPAGDILERIVGKVESVTKSGGKFLVQISYADEVAGPDAVQFLNVVFGNSSIQSGIRVERFELSSDMKRLKGPRFGRVGLRQLLHVHKRPMLCTAIKPMGYSPADLAQLTYKFALGGIDIIKDDHGLADQNFSNFKERVKRSSEAVLKANSKTGYKSIYMPNVTGPADQIVDRAKFAKEQGAGGLLFCPGLSGWDQMRVLADDESIQLPIMSHPALIGSLTASKENGFSHFATYGQLQRLFGADASVFPSWGGRFSFSKEECLEIVDGTQTAMGTLKEIFPTPGGGMTLERIPEMSSVYGNDVIYLIGGGLHRHSEDLVNNCQYFRELVEVMA